MKKIISIFHDLFSAIFLLIPHQNFQNEINVGVKKRKLTQSAENQQYRQ